MNTAGHGSEHPQCLIMPAAGFDKYPYWSVFICG